MEWQVTLPCLPSMVPVARRLVRGLMPESPRLDDAELVLGELAGNAVRYGSGEMVISVTSGEGWARLVVTDSGRPEEDTREQVTEPPDGAPADSAPPGTTPAAVEPAAVEPATVEPAAVESADVESADVEPADVEPADVEPADVEPADVEYQGWDLLIVNTLADRWGFDRALDGPETLWAELVW